MPTISEKNYGKNCHLANFGFCLLPPVNTIEKKLRILASSYVMGLQLCIGGEGEF